MTTPRSRAESTTWTDEDRTGTWQTVILSTWYFEPSHKTWVLVGFRRNRLHDAALSQAAKSAIQRASRSTEVGASLTVDERYTWQSSASVLTMAWQCTLTLVMFLVNEFSRILCKNETAVSVACYMMPEIVTNKIYINTVYVTSTYETIKIWVYSRGRRIASTSR